MERWVVAASLAGLAAFFAWQWRRAPERRGSITIAAMFFVTNMALAYAGVPLGRRIAICTAGAVVAAGIYVAVDRWRRRDG